MDDNKDKIKDLGLKALLEQGNVSDFFNVQLKEKETDSKAQLIGSIARIADMVTQHSEGVFVEEISDRLSKQLTELAEQLAQGLSTDLQGAEEALRAYVAETDEAARADILDNLSDQIAAAEVNMQEALRSQLNAAMPQLAEAARLSEDELQELVDNTALSVESQMSDLLGSYFAENALTPDEIDGFRDAVQNLIGQIDFGEVKVNFDNLQNVPQSLRELIKTGGKSQLKFMGDVNANGITNGQVLAWNSTTKMFEAADSSSLPDQTGNNGKYLTTDGTDASWATLAGGGDMAAATYDAAGVSEQLLGATAAQTVTNKTINADNNTITNLAIGAEVTGTVENLSDVTITTIASGELLKWNGSAWINNTLAEAGIAAASHTHATSDITSGTFADARIAESNVTQHEAALTLTEAQVEAALSAATAFTAGNFVFNTDQTVGVGQDNYVLTYDNATGEIGLEASAGGGLANIVEDTTPQLGGDLASNGNAIRMADANGIYLGTGNDLLMYHDGSDHQILGNNGDFLFDNTDATKGYKFTLGTDTSATYLRVLNNSAADIFNIGGDGTVDLAASGSLSFNGTAILSDSAGTMTLSNVDALDATTEATIEAAIDTLANLTAASSLVTVGTLTSGNADAIVSAASTTTAGKVELATTAETDTGTDTGRAITPDGLAGSYAGKKSVGVMLVAPGTDVATGTSQAFFTIPEDYSGMNLVAVHAEHTTAGTTGVTTYDINKNGTSMLSTKLTVDSAETGSDTAATAAVIDGAQDNVSTNDVITIDVDGVSTTAPQGAFIRMTFQLP